MITLMGGESSNDYLRYLGSFTLEFRSAALIIVRVQWNNQPIYLPLLYNEPCFWGILKSAVFCLFSLSPPLRVVSSYLGNLQCNFLFLCLPLSQEYQGASVLGQFVTRFMLRETSTQLLSLQSSLQYAMEAVEEQSSPAP